MDSRWRLEFADASSSGSNPPSNPPGYVSLKELGADANGAAGGGGKGGSKGASAAGQRVNMVHTPAMRVERAYKFAMGNVQSILMMGFMMYMSGNGVQIFSMMIVFGGIFQPIKAIMTSAKTFERFSDGHVDLTGPRLVFCAIQVLGLGMALYKLNAMGLLPTHASDWLSGMKPPTPIEHAYGGTTL